MSTDNPTPNEGYVAFTNQDLINGYADVYATSLRNCYTTLTGGKTALPFDPAKLYHELFCFEVFDLITIEEIFTSFVRQTPYAYEILKQSWLDLISRFSTDLLRKQSHQLNDIRKLIDKITAYQDLLYDTYFEISRELSYTREKIPAQVPQAMIDHMNQIPSSAKKSLQVYTRFRGMAIERDCALLSIDPQGIALAADKKLQAALKNGLGIAIIDCQALQQSYRSLYDPRQQRPGVLVLSYMTPLNMRYRQQHIRVEPPFNTPVELSAIGEQIEARLLDISLHGVNLYCRTNAKSLLVKDKSLNIKLTLSSPHTSAPLHIDTMATITRVIDNYRHDPHAFRLCLSFALPGNVHELLAAYLTVRQSEILAELNSLGLS